MRVIAGTYRSRPIAAPRGLATRPTSGRLRETLFNVLSARVAGASFADLYAGSGAVGIEALSRGARHVCFAENAAAAVAAIRANLASLKIVDGFHLETRGVAAVLRAASGPAAYRPWDLVFLDPPYQAASARLSALAALGQDAETLLAPDALVIVEHRPLRQGSGRQAIARQAGLRMEGSRTESEDPAEHYGALARYRVIEQGDAALSFYRVERFE